MSRRRRVRGPPSSKPCGPTRASVTSGVDILINKPPVTTKGDLYFDYTSTNRPTTRLRRLRRGSTAMVSGYAEAGFSGAA